MLDSYRRYPIISCTGVGSHVNTVYVRYIKNTTDNIWHLIMHIIDIRQFIFSVTIFSVEGPIKKKKKKKMHLITKVWCKLCFLVIMIFVIMFISQKFWIMKLILTSKRFSFYDCMIISSAPTKQIVMH
jgi:hypothetical protein